jgi:hypothetical protein
VDFLNKGSVFAAGLNGLISVYEMDLVPILFLGEGGRE